MTNLIPKTESQLATMNTGDLKNHFAESLELTAKHMTYMGMIWLELEKRGEDLSDLKKGLAIYIPMIAHGIVEAETVIQYAGQKTLLTALTALSLDDQRKITGTGTIPYFNTETEATEQRELVDLSVRDITQIFNDDKIRTPDQQQEFLSSKTARPGKKRIPRKATRVSIDKQGGAIVTGKSRIDIDSTIAALKASYSQEELMEMLGL